ncbi:uncharacterized protein LOC144096763 isoform X1 [Amblyomma americanum]
MEIILKTIAVLSIATSLSLPSYATVHVVACHSKYRTSSLRTCWTDDFSSTKKAPAIPGAMTVAFLTSCFIGANGYLCEKKGGKCLYNTDCCHRLVCFQVTQTCEPRGPHARLAAPKRAKDTTKPGARAGVMATTGQTPR